jgi:hypothetical protein
MPIPIEIHLQCLAANEAPVTTLRVEPGYSQTAGTECVHVTGWNAAGVMKSVEVVRGYPADCVPLPELSQSTGLAIGVALLAALYLLAVRPR